MDGLVDLRNTETPGEKKLRLMEAARREEADKLEHPDGRTKKEVLKLWPVILGIVLFAYVNEQNAPRSSTLGAFGGFRGFGAQVSSLTLGRWTEKGGFNVPKMLELGQELLSSNHRFVCKLYYASTSAIRLSDFPSSFTWPAEQETCEMQIAESFNGSPYFAASLGLTEAEALRLKLTSQFQ